MSAIGDSESTRAADPSWPSTERIEPYHLLQPLGEGGMGEVWVAEQRQPIRRHVAIKIIKPGMGSRQVVARFDAERQALAVMDHPAIAKVLDAGTTDQGRPYFVMEYVKGEPITGYCDRQRLCTAERLGLFMRVCEGVQHAHQKGIIHRDLKPSNVLVTLQEGRPVPKIIDFGIAKATAHQLTEQTVFTELGVLIGTPEYMSPEQAEMTGLDIDTRTDIYSLGVLLYELLTGALPFDRQELRAKTLDEIRRTIRETDPPRPSMRIAQLGPAATEAARNRLTEPARLVNQLRGDLDWITMRALEKDRTRRYDSATALANDIERHLHDHPVVAGPPSVSYRTKKFARRHRFGVGAAIMFVVFLVAFGTTMAVQAGRIARERDRANREAARANREAEAARQVSDFLVGLFKVSDPGEARGNSITAREILNKGAARVEKELTAQPVVQAQVMSTMGQVFYSLGLYRDSVRLLRQSLELRRRSLGPRDPAIAATLADLGPALLRAGDLDQADTVLNEALAIQETLYGSASAQAATTLGALAELAYTRGDFMKAEALFRRELETLRQLPKGHEEALSNSLNNLGMTVQQTRADYKEALALLGEALAIRRRLFGSVHPTIAVNLNNLAKVSYRLADYDTAEALFRQSLTMNRTLYGNENPEVSANLCNLALVARDRGDFVKANALFEQAVPMDRRVFGPSHLIVAGDLNYWAESIRRSGDARRAEAMIREALAIQLQKLPEKNWQIAATRVLLARSLAQEGRFPAAEQLFLDAIPVLEKQFPPGHPRLAVALQYGAEIYDCWGKPAKAAEWRKKLPAEAGTK